MTIPYSTGKSLSIDQLTNVNITDIANNDFLQYNSTNGVWENADTLVRPYFIKAMLQTEDDTGLADGTDYILGVQGQARRLVAQFSGTDFDYNNGDWSEASSTWTCRETGIYRINAQVSFRLTDSGADRIRLCKIDIYNGATIVASNKMEIESDSSTADDFKEYNSVVNSLLKYDIADTMTMKLTWEIWGSSETMRIIATDGRTFLQIEKVA